ncbi:MAG: thiamine-binding protein [Deltaproteobacteria bacterium]|nr:MAG: thiamine-binding protein [Deltaproteobacteria bacterium]
MAVVEISVTPLGTGTPGVSEYVAGAVNILKQSGLKHQLTPMGTIIEGEIEEIFPVLLQMHLSPFDREAVRVSTLIKIDDRRDRNDHTMEHKVEAVKQHLEA